MTPKKSIIGKTLGIVGGGQLARMLSFSAFKMGLKVSIYSESESDPAALVTSDHTKGSFEDKKKLEAWSKTVDCVTFESEFLDFKDLKLKNHFPSKKCMSQIRDRFHQKTMLMNFKIPTSPFSLAGKNKKEFEKPVVMKKRLFGYDGYGTVICRSEKELNHFYKKNDNLDEWIKEDFISFKRELALSVARNKNGDFSALPLVETFQKDSKCFWVKGPESHKKLNAMLLKVKKMMSEINYVGILAVELFEDQNKNLLVNELAPRVHNSAHYSIEGLQVSQFDLHILSVFNQKLPKKINVISPFAMVNLIGSSTIKPRINSLNSSIFLHWYAKADNRPGRKMGHLTCLDKTKESALKLGLKELKRHKL